jgi:hypothetical protein
MGSIDSGFHFLGIFYSPTRMEDKTTVTHVNDDLITQNDIVHSLFTGGGKRNEGISHHQTHGAFNIVPHPRTMRKAREQVKYMVIDKVSPSKIRNYLNRWVTWWQNTTKIWDYEEIIKWFCAACFDVILAAIYAAGLLLKRLRESHSSIAYDLQVGLASGAVAA